MTVTAVIGANFGDEGKGLLTDYLCAGRPRSLVIRFNGGAQAGHTVVTPSGYRHVFHHVGSGDLAGADTYLSRFFIVNPLLWLSEHRELQSAQRLLVHPDAMLSTPYDMLFNRALERARGAHRHGSCGLGIWETALRCRTTEYRTTVADLFSPAGRSRLRDVRRYFVTRSLELAVSLREIEGWDSAALWDDYVTACEVFRLSVSLTEQPAGYENIVFEGAQGLLLDERHPTYFPYVTGSRTGLDNVQVLCAELNLGSDVEAVYVTRGYMTRHGPGPLPFEDGELKYRDTTNGPNEYQGPLRFGHLDVHELCARVHADAAKMALMPSLAITWLDQSSTMYLGDWVEEFRRAYYSYGPTRDTVYVGQSTVASR